VHGYRLEDAEDESSESESESESESDTSSVVSLSSEDDVNDDDEDDLNKEPKRKKQKVVSSTGFRGVQESGKKFKAQISINGTTKSLGTYTTAKDAARAYDQAILKHNKPTISLNFPPHDETSVIIVKPGSAIRFGLAFAHFRRQKETEPAFVAANTGKTPAQMTNKLYKCWEAITVEELKFYYELAAQESLDVSNSSSSSSSSSSFASSSSSSSCVDERNQKKKLGHKRSLHTGDTAVKPRGAKRARAGGVAVAVDAKRSNNACDKRDVINTESESSKNNNRNKRVRFESSSSSSIGSSSSSRSDACTTKKQKFIPYTDKYVDDETVLEI